MIVHRVEFFEFVEQDNDAYQKMQTFVKSVGGSIVDIRHAVAYDTVNELTITSVMIHYLDNIEDHD